jgi:TfoX/Sxy family transcriptional regulator of competence genes
MWAGLRVAFLRMRKMLRVLGGEAILNTELVQAPVQRGFHAIRVDAHVLDRFVDVGSERVHGSRHRRINRFSDEGEDLLLRHLMLRGGDSGEGVVDGSILR